MKFMAEEKKVKGVYEKIPASGVWWIRYSDKTRIRREKVGRKSAAIQLYQKRKNEVREGKKLPENLRSMVRVSNLEDAMISDYKKKKLKSLEHLESRLRKHIIPFFGQMPANEVGTATIDRYVEARSNAGAESGTINRELAALKRMYNLAYNSDPRLVRDLLRYDRLRENPARRGFVEDSAYRRLVGCIEELWLKALVATAYTFGFRSGELLGLRVEQVDLFHHTIRLDAGDTKNDEGRTIKMTQEVYNLLKQCVAGKGEDGYVFTRANDERVQDFRGSWWALCEEAGLGKFVKGEDKKLKWIGLLFHDLRRSAVRNMIRAGIPDVVAMKISGHKSRSVFDRYNIVSESDLAEAAAKLEKRTDTRKSGNRTDTKTDTSTFAGAKKRVASVA